MAEAFCPSLMDAEQQVAQNGQIGCVWIFQFLLLSTIVSLPVALISWLVQGSVDYRRVWLGTVVVLFLLLVVTLITATLVQATIRRPRYVFGWLAFYPAHGNDHLRRGLDHHRGFLTLETVDYDAGKDGCRSLTTSH